jgi:DNA polymerase-3 subunit alpha
MKRAIAKAKKLGMPALAITDFGSMYGVFKFFVACQDAGIKPIIGCEMFVSDNTNQNTKSISSIVLLAKNLVGYRNLIRIVTLSHLHTRGSHPVTPLDLLEKHHEGLIALTGSPLQSLPGMYLQDNLENAARNSLMRYKSIFGNDVFVQLERHPDMPLLDEVNHRLILLARELTLPLVATANIHYENPDDSYAHEILLCIGDGRVIHDKDRPRSMMECPDFFFKTEEEMRALFPDIPEAIENTVKIASECSLEIPHGSLILPKVPIPENIPPDAYLQKLVNERRDRVKEHDQAVVSSRLEYELSVINGKGYAPYFLFVQDVVNWAKSAGIAVGPGRGSAAGSLVAYCLGITDINPLDYNLPFERFLNPERPTPPDIDIDFADTRRDEVVEYVSSRYGKDKVAQIITFGTMEARMVVRDVGRALGYSYATGDRIAKLIPPSKQGFPMTLEIALEQSPPLKLAYDTEEETRHIIDNAKKLESLPRHVSVHAAGLIVGDRPLIEHIPLQREPKGERVITQYDMYCLDLNAVSDNRAIGLVKADILGLRNLSIIESALHFVKETRNETIDIHEVNLDDQKTYKLISSGSTVGVFQLESAGMRRLAKDLMPTKLSDITAMVALYRPGPMDLIPTFIEGKRNPRNVTYPHAVLRSVLEETYGILVYQEQVIDIAVVMAHMTKSQADLLRMAVGKKKKSLMDKAKKQFIDGCVTHGYTKELAEEIFGFIEKFAAYGFNKSHAASYALISYWTAYIKANYPIEFMTSLLTAELAGATGPMREVKMSQALEECKRMNIAVLPPNINKSLNGFAIENNSIRFGLSAVKNVGSAAIEAIVSKRSDGPYRSFTDFLQRVDLRKVNKKTIESLIYVGAFSEFGNRRTLLAAYPELVDQISSAKQTESIGQSELFDTFSRNTTYTDQFTQFPELEAHEIAAHERELLGFLVSSNPLDPYRQIINRKATKKISEIQPDDCGKTLILAGIVSMIRQVQTKKDNAQMALCTINDGSGSIECVVFPKSYAHLKDVLTMHTPLLVKGVVERREEAFSLLVSNAVDLKSVNIALS